MKAEPEKEHEWLHQLVGNWSYESANGEEGKETFKGVETVRSLGGLWVVAEGKGNMPGGGTAETVMSLGFDPASKRYHGTWIGSMLSYLWIYDGELDAAKRTLTLKCRGPSMSGDGSLAPYEDIIEIVSPSERLLRSRTPGADGQWNEFMRIAYRRER
jgi:hypothetical protein